MRIRHSEKQPNLSSRNLNFPPRNNFDPANRDVVKKSKSNPRDAKADVILKYSADEARNLKSYGEFPESVKINETVDFVGGDLDDDIEFDDVDSDDSGSDGADDIDGI